MKKLVSRKNILKEAGVLLVAAMFVLTAIVIVPPVRATEIRSEDFYPYYEFPPDGWTRTNEKWRGYYGNYCGGGGDEAQFYYSPSEEGTFRLYTNFGDLSTATNCYLEFKHYVNHYRDGYTLKVETSTDPDTVGWSSLGWSISPTDDVPAETVTIPFTGTNPFYVSWTFEGYSWDINWWNIDDVKIFCDNRPPNPEDDEFSVCYESTATFDVLANDDDPDGHTVLLDTFDLFSTQGATITLDDGGTPIDASDDKLVYTAPSGFYSPPFDTFDYTVSDGHGLTEEATVTVHVCCLEIGDIGVSSADPDKLEVKITNHANTPLTGVNRITVFWNFTVDPDAPCCGGSGNLINPAFDPLSGYYRSQHLLGINTATAPINFAYGYCLVTGNACFTLNLTAQVTKAGFEGFCYKIVTGCVADLQLCP